MPCQIWLVISKRKALAWGLWVDRWADRWAWSKYQWRCRSRPQNRPELSGPGAFEKHWKTLWKHWKTLILSHSRLKKPLASSPKDNHQAKPQIWCGGCKKEKISIFSPEKLGLKEKDPQHVIRNARARARLHARFLFTKNMYKFRNSGNSGRSPR